MCCKSLFQPFPYQANWLACITGVRFSGERRQLSPKPERMQVRSEWGGPLRGMSGVECNKTMVCGQAIVFSASPSPLSGASHSLALAFALPPKREKNNVYYRLSKGYRINVYQKAGFFPTKIGRQKDLKGLCQLLVHFKKLIWSLFRINLFQKLWSSFVM